MSSPAFTEQPFTFDSASSGYEATGTTGEMHTAAILQVAAVSRTQFAALLAPMPPATMTWLEGLWAYDPSPTRAARTPPRRQRMTDQEFLAWQIDRGDLRPIAHTASARQAIAEIDRVLGQIMDQYSQGQPLSRIIEEEREAARG